MVTLTKENFEQEVLKAQGPVLVDFTAAWCPPCRMLAPEVAAVAEARPDIKVGKLDVDEETIIALQYGVMSYPTLMLFQDGEVKTTAIGYRERDEILSILTEALA